MTQYARPNADTYLGNYEDQDGATTDIFEAIDEVTASDSDWITSPESPSSEPYVCALSSVTDPQTGASHYVRYRYSKNVASGNQIDLTVELREGYVNEGSKGTLIADWSHSDISATAATAEQLLSSSEANSITDYSDLFLRFVFDEV